ncbi:sirohydrochlorin chelatase [Streptomyces sp. SCSIO ZS0520]|uniref:sirohydrochlorin chelatase n=1 Tax=Streptomyces sp. SCSIO ZS0520 TaxID=2892996 RepID=UPI0021DA042D|nr:sirohydrochlorin chelatase [Streptomyces sp. SCSIO ZS0520]
MTEPSPFRDLTAPLRRRGPGPPLVLVAHGSRDPRALAAVRLLAARLRARRPGTEVRLGHIELNAPLLGETLADLDPGPAVLVPLLFGRGYHTKQDIPAAAAAAVHLDTRIAAPLGPHPLLARALHARLGEAGWPPVLNAAERRRAGVVLAAAGSRDPESAHGTRQAARLLARRLGVPVLPAYACAAAPTVPEALAELRALGRDRAAVASYFTAPGRFAAQCASAAPWIAAEPIGDHPALAELVLRRYDRARAGAPAERRPLASA